MTPHLTLFLLFSVLPQSPDGDIIDCVPSHKQPAFDHPKLKGQKPLVNNLSFKGVKGAMKADVC